MSHRPSKDGLWDILILHLLDVFTPFSMKLHEAKDCLWNILLHLLDVFGLIQPFFCEALK